MHALAALYWSHQHRDCFLQPAQLPEGVPAQVQAGVQMFVALLAIALSLLLIQNGDKSGQNKADAPKIWEAWYILGLTCLFDNAYAWSWGPLGAALVPEGST